MHMTIGKRSLERSKINSDHRVLDARTRAVLQAIATAPKGKVVDAYLRAFDRQGR